MTTPHDLLRQAQALPTGHPDRIRLLQERLARLAQEAQARREAEAQARREAEARRQAKREAALRNHAADLAIQAATLRPSSPERNAVEAAHRHVLEQLRRGG